MNKTVGVCGYVSTGSSAFSDFLREFDDAKVLDSIEFTLTYATDGLEDLEYHVKNYHKINQSVVAIDRFRKFMKKPSHNRITENKVEKITNDFLNKIIQYSWNLMGYATIVDSYVLSREKNFAKKCISKLVKILRFNTLINMPGILFPYKMEVSIMPEEFDKASKVFISDILDAMGREQNRVTVLDQPFEACNPIRSFKFFDNPKVIISDRDPRDHYLFAKNFLRPRGFDFIPCDNVDDYIKYFRFVRKSPPDSRDRNDVIFFNFEELVYDYENTAKKIANFAGVTQHAHKGKYFKPTHSRNNTQLFKKYSGFESDIKKIERELPEYIFRFENYPDIESEGGMFYGSQNRKRR